jgi:hypothetical protein
VPKIGYVLIAMLFSIDHLKPTDQPFNLFSRESMSNIVTVMVSNYECQSFLFLCITTYITTQISVKVPDLIYESSQGSCIYSIENMCGKNTLTGIEPIVHMIKQSNITHALDHMDTGLAAMT